MINLKKYIDKVTTVERRGGRDVVLPIEEACAIRDEITKLLLDYQVSVSSQPRDEVKVEFVGSKW